MNILLIFFAGLVGFVALVVVVLLLAGFRPQRGTRSRSRIGGGRGGDGSGGTTP